MKDYYGEIQVKETKYPLAFTLNARIFIIIQL